MAPSYMHYRKQLAVMDARALRGYARAHRPLPRFGAGDPWADWLRQQHTNGTSFGN